MKNLIQKIGRGIAPVLAVAMLAGCVSAHYKAPRVEESNDVRKSENSWILNSWLVNLGNGYTAESRMEEMYLNDIVGIASGDLKVKMTGNGYMPYGKFNRALHPELFDKICKTLDKDGDKVLTISEVMGAWTIACANAIEENK